jgi:polyisoprenyl-phosphate glycosyltransferase
MSARLLSLIVPVYFEEECIERFLEETTAVLDRLEQSGNEDERLRYEIVFVDDGSRDRTVPLLLAAAAQNDRVKLVELSYNHGKQGALTAGIAHASGDLLLMMDPDLQDPPAEIPRFIAAIDEGYDLVFGVRAEKRDGWLNVLFSKLFWWLLRRFTGLGLPKNLAVMRIFNRAFADRFLRYREQNRFLEGLFVHVGLRQSTLTIQQRERFAGVSKFTFGRKLELAFTAILDFSDLPLRLTMRVGLAMVACSALAGCALVIVKLLNYELLVGWPSLMVALCGGFGLQIFFLGVVGHYVGRTYRESKQRPLFSVKARTNLAPREGDDG